jgi:hypothetical protein
VTFRQMLRVVDRRRLKLEWRFDDALGSVECHVPNWRAVVGIGHDGISALRDFLRRLDERY